MKKKIHQLVGAFSLICFLAIPSHSIYASDFYAGAQQDEENASEKNLRGKVVEKETNEPLIGASVWLKDTSVGCITDADGNFSLSVPAGRTTVIVVSYIGYEKTEKEVGASVNDLTIELEQGTTTLEDVQIVGYGTQRKESVIGSIETVRPLELKMPTASISTGLIGKLGGIVSVQRSGEPGASSNFWIRGISTFGANGNPLVLVDGVERSLDLVEAEDIESFSILKDATATAIYGVRGANGVILITTKRGEEGKPRVSVKVESGVLQLTKVPEMANSVELAQMYNELKGYDYYSADEIEKYATLYDPDLYPNVDWLKTIFKDYTYNQRVTANISGGGAIARYFISGSFYHEDGILRTDGNTYAGNPSYKRYNFRSNLDINLSPSTVLSLTLGAALEQKRSSSEDLDNIWFYAFKITPNAFPIRYSNGYYSGKKEQKNPYYLVTRAGYNKSWKSILNSVISLKQDLSKLVTPGLDLSLKFSFDTDNYNNAKYTQQDDIYYTLGRDEVGNLMFGEPEIQKQQVGYSHSSTGSNATYLEASLNYNRTFGQHQVGALMLYNQRVYNQTANSSINSLPYKNQGLAGRLTYDYDSRYFIEGNFGYNGSENFAKGNRVGFFPSVALGWYVSNESFFTPVKNVISKLKLKASIGQVGNDKINGTRFVYLGTVTNTDAYVYGENYSTWRGQREDEIANLNVSWEVSTKKNIGFELGLFNKLEIHADWYADKRDKIFVRNNGVPAFVGISTLPWDNIGKVKSWGFDGSAEYNHQIRDLMISARATFTYASNKILEYNGSNNRYSYQNQKGQKMYQQRGYISSGLFESDEEIKRSPTQFSESIHSSLRPGDIKYRDINGDGVIDSFDEVPIGYSDIPEITYGFGASLNWRGIDLSFFFQGVGRVTAFESGETLAPFTDSNMLENGFNKDVIKNHWSLENPDPNARYPRLSDVAYSINNNYKQSTFWQRDASYLRLKNIELGYTFPKRWTNRLGLSSLRLYVSGVNLWTWAKDLHLYDPELGSTDGQKYPLNRIYNFGLNVNF